MIEFCDIGSHIFVLFLYDPKKQIVFKHLQKARYPIPHHTQRIHQFMLNIHLLPIHLFPI